MISLHTERGLVYTYSSFLPISCIHFKISSFECISAVGWIDDPRFASDSAHVRCDFPSVHAKDFDVNNIDLYNSIKDYPLLIKGVASKVR